MLAAVVADIVDGNGAAAGEGESDKEAELAGAGGAAFAVVGLGVASAVFAEARARAALARTAGCDAGALFAVRDDVVVAAVAVVEGFAASAPAVPGASGALFDVCADARTARNTHTTMRALTPVRAQPRKEKRIASAA